MPTFKLEEMDENQPYGGDNDMYFRQWRLPSMKPVLDEKLDRDFLDALAKKDEMMRKRAERRQKHSEKYDKKFQNLVKQMSEASVKDSGPREPVNFLRKATEAEMKRAREDFEKEFASPSSTAKMVPFTANVRPRQNPIFGEKMVSLKSLVLPSSSSVPTSSGTSGSGAVRDSTSNYGAHETVFYPQTHDSFNLDHYNGSRPSFAFSGIQGATSTPVSAKTGHFFGIPEEATADDSVFETSKYVTAMESPIQKEKEVQKTSEAKQKALAEELEREKQKTLLEEQKKKQKALLEAKRIQEEEEERILKIAEIARQEALREEERIQKQRLQEEAARNEEKKRIQMEQQQRLQERLQEKEAAKKEASPENPGRFGQGNAAIFEKKASFGSIFGQKLLEQPGMSSATNATTAQRAPNPLSPMGIDSTDQKPLSSIFSGSIRSPIQNLNAPKPELAAPEAPKPEAPATKAPVRPYTLFKNYIALLKTLQDDKKAFETSSDPKFRALLKRTITEKVTVFTERQTSTEARNEILEFFQTMLQKKSVQGFAIIGEAPRIQLEKDEEVNYAVHCIVEKYISLAELDEELAPTISDLISRLSSVVKRVEKTFIVLMFNKSTLLRQNPQECLQKFGEPVTADTKDEKAREWNQEQALCVLFFTVFAKNALITSKGRKMVLNDELLWRYVETSISYVLEVPKAPFILLQLITVCKPRLYLKREHWDEMLDTIESEILPELETDPFPGDEPVISQLSEMVVLLKNMEERSTVA